MYIATLVALLVADVLAVQAFLSMAERTRINAADRLMWVARSLVVLATFNAAFAVAGWPSRCQAVTEAVATERTFDEPVTVTKWIFVSTTESRPTTRTVMVNRETERSEFDIALAVIVLAFAVIGLLFWDAIVSRLWAVDLTE